MADHRILFEKDSTAKYISHLDLMHTMERAFLRAGITIRHTEGFHPHPYVSIPLPLPLGFSSQCEVMEFGIVSGATVESLPEQMNRVLPAGIRVLQCYEGGLPFRKLSYVRYALMLEFSEEVAEEAAGAFRDMLSVESLVIQKKSKKSKKGFTELDLIPLVDRIEDIRAEGSFLYITALIQAQNPGLNPDILLNTFLERHPQFTLEYKTCRRLEILDDKKKVYR